nr:hypothetical protein [Tanacetum cinerariifolium]
NEEHVLEQVRVDEVVDGSGEESIVHGIGEEFVEQGNDEESVEKNSGEQVDKDVPFDNIGVTSLVPEDVLEGDDVDVENADGIDSETGYDNETSTYRKRNLNELRRDMVKTLKDSGRWKYSFYTR